MSDKIYSVRVDGNEITRITLNYDQYKDQRSRDLVRCTLAQKYKIPSHYLKFHQVEPPIKYFTNIRTNRF